MSSLKLLFVGESLVLAGALEKAISRGHQILGIFSPVAPEAAAMRRAGLPVHGPEGDVASFVAAHDFDVLFSIINGHILKPATLALPRLAAVNYHNAPLPAYAGMWATPRAILNGEQSHGVTWHLIEPGIDTGDILAQRTFPLTADETTVTLNLKCTEAALASLDDVFDKLEQGDVRGEPQNLDKRTYFGRASAAPNQGLIDWEWTTETILRLVRACDWGASPNAFGRAKIITPKGSTRIVRKASRAEGAGLPGTILSVDGSSLTAACLDGAVRLSFDAPLDLQPGIVLRSIFKDPPLQRGISGFEQKPFEEGEDAKRPPSVLERLANTVKANSRSPAVESSDSVTSHSALANRAADIAAALVNSGLKPEDGVGILLPAGAEFVAAALGAMQAGGAYVPLNPASPVERLLVEITEAGVTHIVGYANEVPESVRYIGTFIALDKPLGEGPLIPPRIVDADRCAYRIFTSGSSGRPKAVEITHGALANLIDYYLTRLSLGAFDRMTMLAQPTFDASVADIWPVLAAGGTLLVPPANLVLDPGGLVEWLLATRASCTFVPTAVAERLLRQKWPGDAPLRTLLTGGDTLHQRPPVGLPFVVINTYGPTENTVDSLWSVVEPQGGRPAIGRPIDGVTAEVVDSDGNPTPPGSIGELVLGGRQLARGYRRQPELTARSFYFDAGKADRRRYRTGDRVRLNPEGELEFHGRLDDQLQLLGIRVEPGEIEAILKGDDRVLEAACVPIRAGNEITGLMAHVVLSSGAHSSEEVAESLREHLATQLPSAIVPKAVRLHPFLPRTSAGKVDRQVLGETSDTERIAPIDIEPDPISALWRRALPLAPKVEDQSFWDLGGDSLAAMELLLGLEAAIGVRLPIGLFLADPTLNGLRREIATLRHPIATILSEGRGPPLVLWHTASGDLEDYQHLVPLLADRTLIGIMSPALQNHRDAPQSVEEAVGLALTAVRQLGIFEPPALLGYSWGGLLAFEAARQLAELGTPAPFIGLIGTLPPFSAQRWLSRSVLKCLWAIHRLGNAVVEAVADHQRLAVRIAEMVKPQAKELELIHFSMSRPYLPTFEPSLDITLVREQSGPKFDPYGTNRFRPDLGWSRWVGVRPNVRWLEGDHLTIMKGVAVAKLAAIVNEALDQAG